MTDPNYVRSYIGCYSLSKTIKGLGTWFVYRQGNSLACKQMEIKDAAVFAFYVGVPFTPDFPFGGDTHNWLQVQSVPDGTWLGCGSIITGTDDANIGLISADRPPTLSLMSKGPYGIPPATDALWMELIQGNAVAAALWIEILDGSVIWMEPTAATIAYNPSEANTAHQVIPGASGLCKQSFDRVDFGYIFLFDVAFSGSQVTNCNLSNVTFSGIANFSGTVFDGSDLSGRMLDRANFRNTSLKDVNLSGASLKGCDFTGATLDNCNFEGADLTGADLALATLADSAKPIRITRSDKNRTLFTGARVNKALTHVLDNGDDVYNWSYAQLDGASFMTPDPKNPAVPIPDGQLSHLIAQHAVLTGVQFSAVKNPDMRKADLSNAQLGGAAMTGAYLQYAKFDGAIFSSPDGMQRCNLSEANLMNATFTNADMSYAQMPFCYLYGNSAALVGANIMQADFSGAYLAAADFSGIDGKKAAGVNFDGACLVNATFAGTTLSTVSQQRAASFAKACLQGVNFSDAKVDGVNFAGAAVSTGNGSLAVKGGTKNGTSIDYGATVKPTNTGGATCPNGQTGPCSGTMWNAEDAPMTQWHYGP
ncbi:pentapeptide repeat-containing protein [Pseudomonas farris]